MKEVIRFNKRLNHLHYYDPTFMQNYVFLIAPFNDYQYQVVCNYVDFEVSDRCGRDGTTMYSKDSRRVAVVIWDTSASVIFHELIHAAMNTFRKIGDKEIGYQNEESFAYYCGRLAEVLYTYHPSLKG